MVRPRLLPWLRPAFAALLLSAAAALPLSSARAGTPLLIWPIDPVIAPGQQAAALWLENHGPQPAALQVRVFGWKQAAGEETYEAQQAVLPSPPIATIAPGGRQLVRLIATRPVAAGTEQAFRIFIDELPTPEGATPPPAEGASVKLQLRYAVPLFVYGQGAVPPGRGRDSPPPGALQPAVDWDTLQDGGKPVLVLRNTGNAHARVTAVEWSSSDGRSGSINAGLLGYVLAGSQMRFGLLQALPRNAVLRAQFNGRPADIRRAAD